MAATVPVGFDPKPRRLENVRTYLLGGTVTRGMVVGYHDTGVDRSVVAHSTSTGAPVGVALQSGVSGDYIPVAGNGSELKIELSADDGTADAGDWLGSSAVAGTLLTHPGDVETHEGEATGYYTIAQPQEDIGAGSATVGGKGYVRINIGPIWTLSA